MLESKALQTIPASGIREMFTLAEKYEDVVSFGLGEPAFDTPENIIEASCDALHHGYTKYLPNAGLMALREAVAEKMKKHNGFDHVTADNVQITIGASSALMMSMYGLLDVGDEVILPAPMFPNYLGYVHMAGGKSVIVNTYEENQFRLQVEDIEKCLSPRTKAILINSPCNPTGAVLEKEDVERIADIALKHNLTVISDEPYEDIIYDGRKSYSIGAIPEMRDHVITVNSFSKSYAMTGFRIGYMICPAAMRERFTILQESVGSSVNACAQKAALEALTGPQDSIRRMVEIYERRRNLLVNGLNEIPGIHCLMPGGAFYAFANVKDLGMSSREVAIMLLDQVQVLTTPGSAFGDAGEGYLRFSYASSDESIKEGLKRIRAALT